MSRTPTEKQASALGALMEGMSLRAVGGLTGLGLPRLCRLVLAATAKALQRGKLEGSENQ